MKLKRFCGKENWVGLDNFFIYHQDKFQKFPKMDLEKQIPKVGKTNLNFWGNR
jgi:hypothetical protein